MNLAQLSERSGLPPRQIRYLVSEDVLPGAAAQGRSPNAYTDEHLSIALQYGRMHAEGMRHGAIKEILAARKGGRETVLSSHGVDLRVTDPSALAGLDDAGFARLARDVRSALARARETAKSRETEDAGHDEG